MRQLPGARRLSAHPLRRLCHQIQAPEWQQRWQRKKVPLRVNQIVEHRPHCISVEERGTSISLRGRVLVLASFWKSWLERLMI
eukprot:XP_001706463.1 Hypothetical protein GL50803_32204 [Giardia lamblia ATCC 50803]